MLRRHLPKPLLVLVLFIALSFGASAATQYSQLISTHVSNAARAAFMVGGRAHGSGGIVMQGRTTFYFAGDKGRTMLLPTQIKLKVSNGDQLCLQYQTTCYALPIESEFAEPMVRWILEGNETAFSNTEGRFNASRQMESYGLVRRSEYVGHFIAPQLDTPRLFTLLREADYALRYGVVAPLPNELVSEITAQFDSALSAPSPAGRLVHRSWTNADYNTTYVTTLSGEPAEITGRPLRYYWAEYEGEVALSVTNIAIYQDPDDTDSTVVSEIVQLYQTAAILRTLADADKAPLLKAEAALADSD